MIEQEREAIRSLSICSFLGFLWCGLIVICFLYDNSIGAGSLENSS